MMKFARRSSSQHSISTRIPFEADGVVTMGLVVIHLVSLAGTPDRWSFEVVGAEGKLFKVIVFTRWDSNAGTFRQAQEAAEKVAVAGLRLLPDGQWWRRDEPVPGPDSLKSLSSPTPPSTDLLMSAELLTRAANLMSGLTPDQKESFRRVAAWLQNQSRPSE